MLNIIDRNKLIELTMLFHLGITHNNYAECHSAEYRYAECRGTYGEKKFLYQNFAP